MAGGGDEDGMGITMAGGVARPRPPLVISRAPLM
jgi:hypothetical protein